MESSKSENEKYKYQVSVKFNESDITSNPAYWIDDSIKFDTIDPCEKINHDILKSKWHRYRFINNELTPVEGLIDELKFWASKLKHTLKRTFWKAE